MSTILLDTSAYSAAIKGHGRIAGEIRQAEQITITPITLAELLSGFAQGRREATNRDDLMAFLQSPRVLTVRIGRATAERYAAIHSDLRTRGQMIPTNDLWIAACAMEHGLPLVTCDKHFDRVRQIIVRYYDRAV